MCMSADSNQVLIEILTEGGDEGAKYCWWFSEWRIHFLRIQETLT
jgi:hypothetical protein